MSVVHFKVKLFYDIDNRRAIEDITLPEGVDIPFNIRQAKVVTMSDEAVRTGLAVGNHYHTLESNRWEFFVAVGVADTPLFKFRYRMAGDDGFQEVEMKAGDACLIPPGNSHSFIGLVSGVKLFGFSNLAYDSSHDVTDKLF